MHLHSHIFGPSHSPEHDRANSLHSQGKFKGVWGGGCTEGFYSLVLHLALNQLFRAIPRAHHEGPPWHHDFCSKGY